eukprot:227436-Prymnesium_polylepis.1
MPTLMAPLIGGVGWRRAYITIACIECGLLALVLSLLRDWPSSVGLGPDGDPPHAAEEAKAADELRVDDSGKAEPRRAARAKELERDADLGR